MFAQRLLAAVPLSLLLACTSTGGDDLLLGQGPNTTTEEALTSPFIYDADEIVVFDLDLVCVTAPCPTYLLIDRLGFENYAASVTTADGQPLPAGTIPPEGLVVRGEFHPGDWTPGAPGSALSINESMGTPVEFLPYDASAATASVGHDGSVNLLSANHENLWAHSMELDLLGLDAETEQTVADWLYRGRLVVTGWLTYDWWGGWSTLYVTGVREATQMYTVQPTGKQCVTDPCPYWAVSDMTRDNVTEVASIDFRVMGANEIDQRALLRDMEEGLPFVALVLAGEWTPDATGAVMYITENPREDEEPPYQEP